MAGENGGTPPAGGAVIGPGGVAPAQAAQTGSSAAEQPPAWFQSFAKSFDEFRAKTDEKFQLVGKDLGRVRSKFRDDDEQPKQPEQPAVQPKQEDAKAIFLAAQRFGELSAKLPENARKALSEKISSGMSFGEAAALAEFVLSSIPNPPAVSAGATPNGVAASAPQPSTGNDWTQHKLTELARKDPKRFDQVVNDLSAHGISLFSLPRI